MKQCDSSFQIKKGGKCAVIVAHPDDETLWAGGMILLNPQADWSIITLCRKSDAERSVKFFKALDRLHAVGYMGDMGDSPEQSPLNADEVQKTIEDLLPARTFELVITHNPLGEYTRHLRHEETASAVLNLCRCNKIQTKALSQSS
jgi:LmbE family N-acetylglucosaminyl deacetylase